MAAVNVTVNVNQGGQMIISEDKAHLKKNP